MNRQHPLWKTLEAAVAAEAAKPAPAWSPSPLTAADRAWIGREGAPSRFDAENLRARLLGDRRTHIYARRCEYGRVIVVTTAPVSATAKQVPWDAWGRIMRLFGGAGRHLQVLWFVVPAKRTWPAAGSPVGPENINGGYCQMCKADTVVIYRQEDATRVLVHELLHGCCTDSRADPVEIIEAKTEAWAEIVMAAIREGGVGGPRMGGALEQQLAWSAAQNARLVGRHGVGGPADYAWRYTVGKTEALEAMGFGAGGAPVSATAGVTTLRLTPPNGSNAAL